MEDSNKSVRKVGGIRTNVKLMKDITRGSAKKRNKHFLDNFWPTYHEPIKRHGQRFGLCDPDAHDLAGTVLEKFGEMVTDPKKNWTYKQGKEPGMLRGLLRLMASQEFFRFRKREKMTQEKAKLVEPTLPSKDLGTSDFQKMEAKDTIAKAHSLYLERYAGDNVERNWGIVFAAIGEERNAIDIANEFNVSVAVVYKVCEREEPKIIEIIKEVSGEVRKRDDAAGN